MLKILLPTIFLSCSLSLVAQDETPSVHIFEPHVITTPFPTRDITISPDGKTLYFTLQGYNRSFSTIMVSLKTQKNSWSKPSVATFSGEYSDLEASFSPDGKRLYFVSNRPTSTDTTKTDYDIWYVENENGKWSKPQNLGAPINTDQNEFYPSVTNEGAIYFTAQYEGNKGKEDIYVSHLRDGQYTKPESLSSNINTENYEFNAYIAPNEDFIIFSSYGREDDLGGGDLYISFKENEKWQSSIHLPKPYNSISLDYCPFVFNDHFYFTSSRNSVEAKSTYDEAIEQLAAIENGFDNVYITDWNYVVKKLKKNK